MENKELVDKFYHELNKIKHDNCQGCIFNWPSLKDHLCCVYDDFYTFSIVLSTFTEKEQEILNNLLPKNDYNERYYANHTDSDNDEP
jgi:hypothetical protein